MSILAFISEAAFYAACFLVTSLMVRTGYRLLLHPLKDDPGPQLAKISDSYSTYHSIRKSLHLATRQDHLEYGPVIRQGPNKLVFNSVKALHDIYDNDRVDKASTYLVSLFTPYPNLFNVIDKNRHRVKRRPIGRLLSESSMRNSEPIMMKQVDIFVQQLPTSSRASASAPINMSDRSKYIGADIVGHLAFGYDLRLQSDPEHRHIAEEFKTGNHRLNVYMQSPTLAMLRLEPIAQLINLVRKKSYLRLLQWMIKSRLKEEKDAKYDLYSHLADDVDAPEGDSLSLSETWSEALFFFPAGGETATTGIAALFFYLSRSAAAYERRTKEIRSTFASGAEIKSGPQLAGCHYLRACIDEALHHNQEYFPDPFAFRPERWLPSETPEARRRVMNSAFAALQVGPRGCAGKAVAYLQFSLIFAKTLWYFDLETTTGDLADVGVRVASSRYPAGDGRNDEYQLHDVLTTDHDGPYLIVRPREEVCKDLEPLPR